MPRQKFLRVRNFEKLQHYKERAPIWIKLYTSILDDYNFQKLADAERFHAIGLMLLASRLNNRLPNDAAWLARKIGATEPIDLQVLLDAEFLEFEKPQVSAKKVKTKPQNVVAFQRKENPFENLSESKVVVIGSNVLKIKSDEDSSSLAQRQNRDRTETHTEHNANASGLIVESSAQSRVVCVGSQFSIDEIGRYVDRCITEGQLVRNRAALITKLKRTGDADEFILEFLKPKEYALSKYGEPRRFADAPCQICFGSKMEIVKGKGSRRCLHCVDERGLPTGKEPNDKSGDDYRNIH